MTARQDRARYNKTKQKSSYQGCIQQSNKSKGALEVARVRDARDAPAPTVGILTGTASLQL